jgi:hypothetical protein
MILFETTTPVFELMWDIALGPFIIHISSAYFLTVFVMGLEGNTDEMEETSHGHEKKAVLDAVYIDLL